MLEMKPGYLEARHKKREVAKRSRGKGHRGEYGACKLLCEWYGIEDSFVRSKTSGANMKFGQAGDISCPPGFLLVPEVKNDESWTLSQILEVYKPRGGVNNFWLFWNQTVEACNKYNELLQSKNITNPNYPIRYPILTFTQNGEEYLCMIEAKDIFNLNLNKPDSYLLLEHKELGSFVIMKFEDFLNANPPDKLFARK